VIPAPLSELADLSASPARVRVTLERLVERVGDRLTDLDLAATVCAVVGASRDLATKLEADPHLVEVLARLDDREPCAAESPEELRAWKDREYLRLAARDLTDRDTLVPTIRGVSVLARDVLEAAVRLAEPGGRMAVIGMGKLGGDELNYASDVDVLFVGEGDVSALERDARRVMAIARDCFRVDANLRPQGRDGALVHSLASYRAYWDRWAEPWEFQALLKARTAAGDPDLGAAFDEAAARVLWQRTFTADDLRSIRHLKARMEAELARKGLTDREVKRGRGGIRDIEFAVQLLQLVHGRLDADLRSPSTIDALDELAIAGYVEPDDADALYDAYGFLRRLEHRLQLHDGAQVYAVPLELAERDRIARTLGMRDTGEASAVSAFETALGEHQATVRSIHERLYFRPLLEAFASNTFLVRPGVAEARLAAFGFSDSTRTRQAVGELTHGLTRSSRLMAQMLPLVLGWLSDTPDPDLGLLCLRTLVDDRYRAEELTRMFRESPEAARRLCRLVGTSRTVSDMLQRNLDVVARLPDVERLRTKDREQLEASAGKSLELRPEPERRQAALRRWKERNLLGVITRDLLGEADVDQVGADVTAIAEAVLEVALDGLDPAIPFSIVALGRFGGAELSYASDLDVLFVYEGGSPDHAEEALRIATGLRKVIQGAEPASRLWEVDVNLRPEGKQGLLARTVGGYQTYFRDWALVWERQAMLRARPVAGTAEVGQRFMDLLGDFVWAPGLSEDDRREIRRIKARVERERIPAGEDPQFHLKLGRGSLSDVEWTVQLLQLEHRVAATGTMEAIAALEAAEVLSASDAETLAAAYRFCEQTRNRLWLVRGGPGDALPTDAQTLTHLARSLETTPVELRDRYRRVTRRCRTVMERLFYGRVTS